MRALTLMFGLTAMFFFIPNDIEAQDPGPDCSSALVVCANIPISFNPSGGGINDFANGGSSSGCLVSGEHQSAWFYFEFQDNMPPNSTFDFVIDPTGGGGQDYDFAVFGPDVECDALGAPIRCSYAGSGCAFCPQTGLGNGAGDVSEGAGGDGFVATLTVQPGQGYFLLVDNFSATNIGFDLNLSGTAAPFLDCTATPTCELSVTLDNDISVCQGSGPMFLNSFVTGNLGPVSYLWSATGPGLSFLNNPTSPSPTLTLPPGFAGSITYTLSVDDGTCDDMASITVTSVPNPSVNITGPLSFCAGNFTILDAGPGYSTYNWSNGPGTQTITVTTPGTYSVTVTNSTGCQATATVNVQQTPGPTPVITGDATVCAGGTANLQTDNGYSIYSWSTGSFTPQTVVYVPGTYFVTVTDQNGCEGVAQFDVFPSDGPPVTITGNIVICDGASTTLDAGFGFTNYQWSVNEFTQTIEVTTPGNYFVSVTDAGGCIGQGSISVFQAPSPDPSIIGPSGICVGSTATLSLDANYNTYLWSDFSTQSTLQINAPGTYQVTVTNLDDCEGVAEIVIPETTAPEPTITGDFSICQGENTVLDAGPGFQSYLWSDNSTGQTLTVSQPGNYTVEVEGGNNCVGSATVIVTLNPLPNPIISGDALICSDGSTTLDVGTGFNTYLWSNTEVTPSIDVNTPGQYIITVTNVEGCEATASFTVGNYPDPTPSISGDNQICPDGGESLLTANSGYAEYSWSGGETTTSVTAVAPGTYVVSITDTNGCTAETSFQVTSFPQPMPQIAGDLFLCPGDSSRLTTGNFDAYSWTGGITEDHLDVSTAGTYGLTVTDNNGCTGEDEVLVEVDAVFAVDILGEDGFCTGGSTELNAGGGYSAYVWNDNSTNQTLDVNLPGQYSVTVTNASGCEAEGSIAVEMFDLPTVDITGTFIYCPGGAAELMVPQDFASYLWSDNSTGAEISVSTEGAYSVTVTDSNGCQAMDEATVTLQEQLNPVILGVLDYCAGSATELNVEETYTTYDWSNGGDEQINTINTPGDYSVTVSDDYGCVGEATVSVVENPLPVIDIGGDVEFCQESSTILDAGNGYVDYLWSDSTTNQTLQTNTPGTYEVVVTDNNGCVGSEQIDVAFYPEPQPDILGPTEYCPGTSAIISGEEGYVSYSWSTGSINAEITVVDPGTYNLEVIDTNGCLGTASVDISEFTTIDPNISGALTYCPETSTQLNGGAGFVDYQWSNDETGQQLTVTTPGDYSLTVTDANGCLTTDQVSVNEFTVTPPTIDASAGFCTGTDTVITASAGYQSYLWSTNATQPSITINDGGDYGLTVTDTNGCVSTAEVTVDEFDLPTVNIGGSSSFCIGGSTTLNAGATFNAYLWSDGTTQANIEVSTPGSYALTVTDNNGCQGEGAISVSEDIELNPIISGALAYCENASTDLDAGQGFVTYLWSNNTNTQTLVVDEPGIYSVTVSDGDGCFGDAEVEVIENPLPEPIIQGELGYCPETSTTLDAGSGYEEYVWSNSEDDQTITIGEPGIYSVMVTDTNGCSESTAVTVEEYPNPVFSISGTPYFCFGETTELSVGESFATYLWSNGTQASTISVGQASTIGVTVTNDFGCIANEALAIEEIALPDADAGLEQFMDCDDREVAIGGPNTSEGPNYNYQWQGPGINAQNEHEVAPVVTENGTYTLIVTDEEHGCISESSEVEVADLAYIPVVILEVSEELDCLTNTVLIDGTSSTSGPDIIYTWFDQNGSPISDASGNSLTVSTAQTYILEVYDLVTGCNARDSIQVDENEQYPIAIAGQAQHLNCYEPSATLDGSASQSGPTIFYQWNALQGAIASGVNTNAATVNQPGIYELIVTDEFNGCTNSDTVFVSQDIEAPIANAGLSQELDCLNPTVDLDGSGSSVGSNITYSWSLNGSDITSLTGNMVTVEQAGNYSLLVTNTTNGCSTSDIVEVTINDAFPSDMLVTIDDPTCFGDTDGSLVIQDVVGGTPPFLYSINGAPFSGSTNFVTLPAGFYDLVVQDALGCEFATNVQINEGNDLIVDLGEDLFIDLGESEKVEAQVSVVQEDITSVVWQSVDSIGCVDANCLSFGIQPQITTSYTVTVTDENGCVSSDQITVFVNKPRDVYIPNVFSPNGDGQNDIFMIFGGRDVEKVHSFLIFNRWGETLFEVYNFPPNDPTFGWNGNYRARLYNSAVFTYFAEIEFIDGEVIMYKGDVTLMR
ncbi:MAG: hypothetical protein DHS20C18_12890 [Saprospiraceae bacterium]|nr:MAG: hypothetical protein DHS20C18_12890 [Saprospiraceae bacterium]